MKIVSIMLSAAFTWSPYVGARMKACDLPEVKRFKDYWRFCQEEGPLGAMFAWLVFEPYFINFDRLGGREPYVDWEMKHYHQYVWQRVDTEQGQWSRKAFCELCNIRISVTYND